jgi:hypothetical protein
MAAIIDIVDGDDWKGLYINDKLVLQDHDLDLWDVLKLLQDEVVECRDYIHADLDWMESVGHLPNHLDDVVRQKEPDDETT